MNKTALITLLLVSTLSLARADILWDGSSSSNFSNVKNWNLVRLPNISENVVFPDGITRKELTNDLGTPLFQKLIFRDDGYTLTGTPIRLGAGGVELVDSTGFTGPVTLNLDINIQGPQTFFIGGDATEKDPSLVLNGRINLRTSPLTVAGGAVTLAGEIFAGAAEAPELTFSGKAKTISSTGKITLPAGRVVQSSGQLHLAGLVTAREMVVRGVFDFTGIPNARFTGTGLVDADFNTFFSRIGTSQDAGTFGRLTFMRRTTLSVGSQLVLRLGSPATPGVTYDQIRILDTLQFQDGSDILLEPGKDFAPSVGQTFILIDKTSAGSLNGSLGFVEGAIRRAGNAALRLSYVGGDGNDVTARVVELAPTLSKITDQGMFEDSVLKVDFTIADPNTSLTRLAVTATSPNAILTIQGTGSARSLIIQPPANFFGSSVPVTVSVSDGAITTSQTFLVQVVPVNDAPSFTAISPLTSIPNSASVTLPAAGSISVGPGEATLNQSPRFEILSNSNPGLFRVQPTISPDGKLTCTPFDQVGTALLSVRLVDDGGTTNGGVNASAPQQIELRLEFPPISPFLINTTAWNGSVSGDWNTGANWSGNAVPLTTSFPSVLPSGTRAISTTGGVNVSSLLFEGSGYRLLDNPNGLFLAGHIEVQEGNSIEFDVNVNHGVPNPGIVLIGVHNNATLRFNKGLRSPLPIGLPNSSSSGSALVDAAAALFINFQFTTFPQVKAFTLLYEEGGQVIFDGVSQLDGSITALNTVTIAGPGQTIINGSLSVFFMSVEKGSPHVTEVNGTLSSELHFSRSSSLRGRGGIVSKANAGGRIQPGGSLPGPDQIGILTINDLQMVHDLSNGHQSVLELDLGAITTPGTTYDQLRVTSLNIASGAALALRSASGFAPFRGQQYVLVQVAGSSGGRTGTFAGLPEGSILRVDGTDLRISYFGGDGNDITGTVENSAPILLGLSNQTINEDGTAPSQTITIANTLVSNPSLSVGTSNPALVPLANINVTGTGSTRTVSFTPAAHQHGTATITVSANDGTAVGSGSFEVTVLPVNDVPTFIKGPDVIAARNAGSHNLSGWATAVSAGPANESAQTVGFEIVSNNNAGLFVVSPAVSPAGTLSFTPNSQISGTATIGLRLKDNGGTDRSGQDTSAVQTFTITTLASNTPPSFTTLGNVRVTAGTNFSTQWATVTSKGSSDEVAQSVAFLVETDHPELFGTAPAVDAAGVLTLSPLLGAGGQSATLFVRAQDNGGTLAGGVDTSPAQSFTVQIETNAPPQAFGLQNQQLLEGATQQAQAFRLFGSDLANPEMTVSTSNPELIPASNIILTPLSFAGILSYTPLPDASGSTTLTLTVNDGNAVTSSSIVVTVTPVNDAPSFIKGPDVTLPRGAGPQSLAAWAPEVSVGPEDESEQAAFFEVISSSNPSLFSVPPSVNAAGTLFFTPNREISGTSTISLRIRDDGGTSNSGVDTSLEQTFTITTLPTNNAPTFTPGPVVKAPAGITTTVPWATEISAGPADESSQTLQFTVETTRPELFTTAPTLSPTGEFSISPVAGASGEVTFVVRLQDNGGTENGGADRSPLVGLTVRIGNIDRTPGSYFGLAEAAPEVTPAHTRTGFLTLKVTRPGSFSGKLVLGGVTYSFTGTFSNSGRATFGRSGESLALARRGLSPLSLSLQFDAVSGDGKLTGTVLENGQPFSLIAADRAIYDAKKNPMLSWIVDGQGNKGKFTVAFPALVAPNRGFEANAFPQGDGWANLTIALSGKVTLAGRLADGTALTLSSFLTAENRVALHARLYGGKGSISGRARYQNLETSDANGINFLWFRPVQLSSSTTALYPNGWPGGIHVDFEASRLVAKASPYFRALTPADADGNLFIIIDDLSGKSANLDSANKIILVTLPDLNLLKNTFSPSSGRWTGSFKHPTDLKKKTFSGIVLQKSNRATGYYIGPTGSGRASFLVMP